MNRFKNQVFHTCYFNLRKASGFKPIPIYLVANIGGKQMKLATGVKVKPEQWDKGRQIAIVSNLLSEIDNYNNQIVNDVISNLKVEFLKYLDYLCTRKEDALTIFKRFFVKNQDMTTNEIIRLIRTAFDLYYKEVNPTAKESTKKQQYYSLNKFITYVEKKAATDLSEILDQKSLNDFRSDLINAGESAQNANQCGGIIVLLINKIMSVHNDFLKYEIKSVNWLKIKDVRTKEDKTSHFPLTEEEIQAIKDCKNLNEKEKQYRSLFLLQIESGLRVSDLIRFVNKEYEEKENGYYHIKTKKTNHYSMIVKSEIINRLLKETECFIGNELRSKTYNEYIKKIAEKSGLNRNIKGKTAKGEEYEKPIYQLISSHCARYTFITNMCKMGMPKEKLIFLTGHADTTMIDDIYLRYSEKDKAKLLDSSFSKIQNKKGLEKKQDCFAKNLVTIVNGDFTLPVIKTIISVIKDINNIEPNYRKDDAIKLDNFYYELSRYYQDTSIYRAYQTKLVMLGYLDKVIDNDILINMFQNDEEKYYSENAKAERFLNGN